MNKDFYEQKAELERSITELCKTFAVEHTVELRLDLSVSLNVMRMGVDIIDTTVREVKMCVSTTKAK